MSDLRRAECQDQIKSLFVKIRFADFTRTTVERAGLPVSIEAFIRLLRIGLDRKELAVRLLGVGVHFNKESPVNASQLELF